MFGRATIRLGIGPHSSCACFFSIAAVYMVNKVEYLVTALRMTKQYLYSLPASVQYEEKSFWGRNVVRHKKWEGNCLFCLIGSAAIANIETGLVFWKKRL